MFTEKNVLHFAVGSNQAAYKAGDLDSLAVGQIAVVSIANVVDNLGDAVTGRVRLVYKSSDGELIFSPVIDTAYITTNTAVEYTAATQQLSYIGYNGSSGAIDATDNNLYSLDIEIEEDLMMLAPHPYIKAAFYTTSTGATQEGIAGELIKNLVNNFSRDAEDRIRFSRLSDAATEADVVGTTAAVAHGSRQVTLGVTYTGLVINDYLSLDGVLYKVINIVGNTTITLDIPYQGITELIATGDALRVTNANAIAADWGIRFQGLARTNFREGVYKYQVYGFKLLTSEGEHTGSNPTTTRTWGATNFTTAVQANKGIGTYEETAEIEWFAQGNRGDGIRVESYSPARLIRKDVVQEAGKGYDYITLEWNDNYQAQIGNVALSFKQLIIATHSDATGTVHADLKTAFGIA
jgi:hypothetical protein